MRGHYFCPCFYAKGSSLKSQVTLIGRFFPAVSLVNRRWLEQVLTNLIENTIKFNREQGSVSIKFETGARDRIIVEDSGEGIPGQHLERRFERFYRVDRARSREQGGMGVGPAIVKHLVRAADGDVTGTSEVSKGSIFTIELPPRSHTKLNIA